MKRNIIRNTFKVAKVVKDAEKRGGFEFNSKFYATVAFGTGAICEMYTYKTNGGLYGSGIGVGLLLAIIIL